MGFTDLVVTLLLLGANVEQTDAGFGRAVHRAMKGLADNGEFDQALGVAVDIGANIQHRLDALGRRPARHQGRALEAGHHAQNQLGDSHQRASVAGGDGGVRPALANRLHRIPQAGALAAAHGLGGFLVRADDQVGMLDVAQRRRARRLRQLGVDLRLVAMQQEANSGGSPLGQVAGDGGDDHGRAMVAAHGVDRDYGGVSQGGGSFQSRA